MDAGSVAGVAAQALASRLKRYQGAYSRCLNCANAAEVHNHVSPIVRNGRAKESGFLSRKRVCHNNAESPRCELSPVMRNTCWSPRDKSSLILQRARIDSGSITGKSFNGSRLRFLP
jgi:hypothetical protein